MCGRVFQTLPLMRLLQIARTKRCTNGQMHTSSYNVCPTTYIPVIKTNRFYIQEKNEQEINDEEIENQECRELAYMSWGHKTQNNFVINGRIEELLNKRMFVDIIKNRCVVILEGYYQWNQKKQAFSLRPKDGDHFLVAGLYTKQNEIVILTKDATPQLSKVHHRMPVFLSHEEVNIWMNPKNTKDIQNIITKSLLKKDKEVWKNVGFAKVAPYVSNLKEKSVKCLMSFEDYKKQLDKTGLMKYWKKAPVVQAVGQPGQIIQNTISKMTEPPKEPVHEAIEKQVKEKLKNELQNSENKIITSQVVNNEKQVQQQQCQHKKEQK